MESEQGPCRRLDMTMKLKLKTAPSAGRDQAGGVTHEK